MTKRRYQVRQRGRQHHEGNKIQIKLSSGESKFNSQFRQRMASFQKEHLFLHILRTDRDYISWIDPQNNVVEQRVDNSQAI